MFYATVSVDPRQNTRSTPRKQLTLFDSTCLIAGIIIGAGIYEVAPAVAGASSSSLGVYALWLVGGILSLSGALCYAELATAYTHEGGDYVYLGRAYGPWAGFLFGWTQLTIVRPGDIAAMAFVFARFGGSLLGVLGAGSRIVLAISAVVMLSAINIAGVRAGKWTQNTLAVVKTLGLVAILAIAFFAPPPAATPAEVPASNDVPLSLALILVLFTFGGWNEMAYVAAEVKNPRRNIVRALVIGTSVVTVLYLLTNVAFLAALGHSGTAASHAVAADTVKTVFPHTADRVIAALICISALGALNGLVFTGARISYAVGADHRPFRLLGRWNPRTGTPAVALAVQAGIAVVLIALLGSFLNTVLYTAAAVYTFYLATTLAVVVLRRKDPGRTRHYRVTGYPVTPLLFAAVCAFLIYSAIAYDPTYALVWIGVLLMGLPVYCFANRGRRGCGPG